MDLPLRSLRLGRARMLRESDDALFTLTTSMIILFFFIMPYYFCNAPGCNSAIRKKENLDKYPWMANVTFHSFPHKREHLARQTWMRLLRREPDWMPNKLSRVCSRHFVGGSGPTEENPNPTLFAHNNYGVRGPARKTSTSIRAQSVAATPLAL